MRKLVLTFLLAICSFAVFAQKLNDVKDKIEKEKYDDAKEKIDKILAEPKYQNNADAWFYKARIYQVLGKLKTDTALSAQALDAMVNYVTLEERNNKGKMLLSGLEGNKTAYDIYSHYFLTGAESFNSRDYETALYSFERALTAFQLLSRYKMTDVQFDTATVLYAGFSAESLRNHDLAMSYYTRIADQRIADTSYVSVYEYIINQYITKNDMANARKYLDLSQEIFPEYNGWLAFELDMLGDDRDARMVKYEELLKKYPNNYELAMDYAIQMLNYTYAYADEERPADYLQRQEKVEAALQQVFRIQETALANYIMARHINNQIADMEEEMRNIRGNAQADVAKRKELKTRIDARYEDLFRYSEKTFTLYSQQSELKPNEKAYLREVTNNLIYYYQDKKQNDKVSYYQGKLKAM